MFVATDRYWSLPKSRCQVYNVRVHVWKHATAEHLERRNLKCNRSVVHELMLYMNKTGGSTYRCISLRADELAVTRRLRTRSVTIDCALDNTQDEIF